MSLHALAHAVEGAIQLSAKLSSCFSEKEFTVILRWNGSGGEVEASEAIPGRRRDQPQVRRRRRALTASEALRWAERIVEAAERDEMTIQDTSTTSHSVILHWEGSDATGSSCGEASFFTRSMLYGDEAVKLLREVSAPGQLTEKGRAIAEEGLAKGFHIRAMALFDLAEEILASMPFE